MSTKACVVCGATFTKPGGMHPARWAARTCCSRACGSRLPRKERYVQPAEKDCAHCGCTFPRPANYRGHQWADRKYCSRACMGQAKREEAWAAQEERSCPICGVAYRRPAAEHALHGTCGDRDCKRTYARTIRSQRALATYRRRLKAGEIRPHRGRSKREMLLWPLLRDHGWLWQMRWFEGEHACFELDFMLWDRKLNVEIDGPEHGWGKRRARDAVRDARLREHGWTIIRIPNEEVDADPEAVARRILAL